MEISPSRSRHPGEDIFPDVDRTEEDLGSLPSEYGLDEPVYLTERREVAHLERSSWRRAFRRSLFGIGEPLTGPTLYSAHLFYDLFDVTDYEEDELAELRHASKARDEHAIVRAIDRIDWTTRTETEFIEAIRLAITGGAHLAARSLAASGISVFPESNELLKIDDILAPPEVRRASQATNSSDRQADRNWLEMHSSEYQGRWVGLRAGQLLAHASSAHELKERLDTLQGILIVHIPANVA